MRSRITASIAAAMLAWVPFQAPALGGSGQTMFGAGTTVFAPQTQIVVDAYAGTARGTGGIVFLHSSGPASPGFIDLDCVVISDIGATAHGLQASGEGDDGVRYYVGVRDWGASSLGDWAVIFNQPVQGPCGALVPENTMFFPTAFVTTPA